MTNSQFTGAYIFEAARDGLKIGECNAREVLAILRHKYGNIQRGKLYYHRGNMEWTMVRCVHTTRHPNGVCTACGRLVQVGGKTRKKR